MLSDEERIKINTTPIKCKGCTQLEAELEAVQRLREQDECERNDLEAENARLQKEVEELRVEGARSDDLVWDQTDHSSLEGGDDEETYK